jgi:Fe(3+) dicitrate transport protein
LKIIFNKPNSFQEIKIVKQESEPSKNRFQLKILFAFLIFIFATNHAFSQTAKNCLCGTVKDTNGDVIAGATVRVLSSRNVLQTDSAGNFNFQNFPDGRYEIIISAEGFAPKTETVEVGRQADVTLRQREIAETVMVTTNYLSGTPDALERTAGSLQFVSKDELEISRVYNFSEALRKIAGVNVRDEEGFGLRPNIGIRGTNPTRSTKILLLEDGLPLAYAPYGDNASYYHPPVERFESIEVLKGSGQIEYGPVTVAGVVNYITPNPPDQTSFSLKLIGGNRDYFNGNAQFGGTYGKTGVIFNLNRKQGLGARDNIRSGLNDFFTKVVQNINSRNVLTAKFSYLKEDSQITYSGLTEAEYAANPRQNPFLNDTFNAFRQGFSLSHTGILSARSSVTTNFYTNYFSRDWWRQSSNSGQRPNRLNSDPDCRSMADLYTTCGMEGRLRDYRNFGIEPRFNTNFNFGGVRNDFNAGFRYHHETQSRLQKNGDLPKVREGVISENNFRENSALAGFVQNRIIWKDFALTAGLRIENINFKRENRINGLAGETELTEYIPGTGVTYNVLKNTTIFAGVHRGFAPPRTEDIITNAGGVVELDSELSWNYEAGVRTRAARGLSFDATFFRTDYENQIVPASVAGGIGAVFTNGGKTLHQGFEISSRFDSSNFFKTPFNLYVQTNYTNLFDAEFRGARFSSISGFTNISVTGNRLPYAPKHLVNVIFGYAHRNFNGFVENVYIGSQFSDDLNTINSIPNGQRGLIPSQTYWNVTANYKVEKLKSVFFVTAKNIFDRTFIVDRSRGIIPSSPRLLQGGVKISF